MTTPPLPLGSLFTGKLVRLAAPLPADNEIMARWTQDAEYMRQLDDDPVMPRAADHFKQDKPENEWHGRQFRIRTLTDDTLIGFTALFWMNLHAQSCMMAIAIGEEAYRNRGYGTDAFRLTVSYAFRELGLHRVSLGVMAYNTRAVHVYEKSGFVREVVQRQTVYRDGVRHDTYGMAMLRPEWEIARQSW